ncbi:MAG: ABC transporter substrate-binding protein [Anaerolineales bacterium]
MKGKLFITVAVALAIGACQSTIDNQAPAEAEMDHLRIVMSYRPDVQFAPFYVADSSGYFEENDIAVKFEHLAESESVQLVGADEIQFAIVSGEQVLLARAQGLPVVYVMAWWQDYPIAVAAAADSGIDVPADLVGKHVGFPGVYGAAYIGLRALRGANGIKEADINLDPIGFTQAEALFQGTVDAAVVYANNEPVRLEAQGFPVVVMPVADYVKLPSNGLITNEKTLAENPDLVRRMVRAILRGIRETIDNPGDAYEIAKDYVEGLAQADETIQYKVLEASIEYWIADPLGYSEADAWENMQSVLLELEFLQEPVDLSQAYTNDYLP